MAALFLLQKITGLLRTGLRFEYYLYETFGIFAQLDIYII